MKKTLLSLSLLTLGFFAKAQTCSDLIISEYVEGTENNKALEFYNTSSSPISLANYRVIRWDNGSTTSDGTPEGVMNLPSNITLQPYTTYVIALNLTDPNGTGQNAPINSVLQAAADTLLCPGCATGTGNSRVMCFNGDDALELQKNGVTVDIFACKGERPTNSAGLFSPTAAWTTLDPFSSIPPTYDSGVQGPYFKQYWTQDKTLKRKKTILTGVTTNPPFETFNPSVQWDSLPVNTYSGLGAHECDCNQVGIKELKSNFNVSLFPNPAKNFIQITSTIEFNSIVVVNVVGQVVQSKLVERMTKNISLDFSDLNAGIYNVIIRDNKNNVSNNKFIKE